MSGLICYKLALFKFQLGFNIRGNEIWMYPMAWHAIVLACFSSLIAPFGGFFASGFKRAFKVKVFLLDSHYIIILFLSIENKNGAGNLNKSEQQQHRHCHLHFIVLAFSSHWSFSLFFARGYKHI